MTFKHIITTSTVLLGAALMALPSGIALAQGGNNPVEGIDIIIKDASVQAPSKPFSLTADEIRKINSIKGPERLVLVLQAVTKRVKTDEGFVKSGMAVMGKDWCGDCAWPKEITYKFQNSKTTYQLGMTLSEGATDGDLTRWNRAGLSRLNSTEGNSKTLQFDEADAYFSKRGEIRDTRDRYANLEVSHLLAADAVEVEASGLDDKQQLRAEQAESAASAAKTEIASITAPTGETLNIGDDENSLAQKRHSDFDISEQAVDSYAKGVATSGGTSAPAQLKEGDYPLMAGWFMSKSLQKNLNTMSFDELVEVNGIGEATAKKILEYRANKLISGREDLWAAGISD